MSDAKKFLKKYQLQINECVYLGNDTSDIDCLNHFDLSFTPLTQTQRQLISLNLLLIKMVEMVLYKKL